MNKSFTENYRKPFQGSLPKEWRYLEAGEFLKEQKEKNRPHLPLYSVTRGRGIVLQNEVERRDVSPLNKERYKVIKPGNIVYNTMRMWQGVASVSDVHGIVSPAYTVLEVNDDAIPDYLGYLFKHKPMINIFHRFSQGLVDDTLNLKYENFKRILIPLPTKEEQQKIVAILTSIDEAIEKTEAIIDQTEKVKKGLMQQLLTEGMGHTVFKQTDIGKIPESWQVKSINKLIEENVLAGVQDGNHGSSHPRAADYVEEGIPFVMANNLKDGSIDFLNCNFISKKQADSLRIGFSVSGDVLLSHKGTIGRVAIVPEIEDYCMLTPQVTYYRLNNEDHLLKEFLAVFFSGEQFQSTLTSLSAQSTRSYIGITNQKKLLIAIPPVSEQREIVRIVSSVSEKLRIEKAKLKQLNSVKVSLMQVLLTGKKRVNVEELGVVTS